MTEIIIAIILHLATLAGGTTADKKDAEKADKTKNERPINGSGGGVVWEDN